LWFLLKQMTEYKLSPQIEVLKNNQMEIIKPEKYNDWSFLKLPW
jgi:hypothetical protein